MTTPDPVDALMALHRAAVDAWLPSTGGTIEDAKAADAALRAAIEEALARERERCALVCDDEARIREEAGKKHPKDSPSRGRCFAAARAAIICAKGIRSGEVIAPPAAESKPDQETAAAPPADAALKTRGE